MRTNIDLDEKLLAEASKLSGISQKRKLVHEALRVYIQIKRRLPLSDLRGKISFRSDYDYKKLRAEQVD